MKIPTAIDVDEYDPFCHQVVAWNEDKREIEGVLRVRRHADGLRHSKFDEEFEIAPDHALRNRRVIETRRLAVAPGGIRCNVMWRIAAAAMAARPGDLIAGMVTMPRCTRAGHDSVYLRWVLQSASADARHVRGLNPADLLTEPVDRDAPIQVPPFSEKGYRALKSWAREEQTDLPLALVMYARAANFRSHFDAINKDLDFGNALSLLHWMEAGKLGPLANKAIGVPGGPAQTISAEIGR